MLATNVPVELGGGGGATGLISTDNGMDFRDELMAGWVSGTFFISRTTLGALDDLGYVVDYSNAGLVTQMVEPEASSLGLCLFGVGLLYRRRQTDSR